MTTLTISHDIDCERESASRTFLEACMELRFLALIVFPILIDSESESDPDPIIVRDFGPTDVTLGVDGYTIINDVAQSAVEDLLDQIEEIYPGIITGPIDHFVRDCTRQGDFVVTGFIQE